MINKIQATTNILYDNCLYSSIAHAISNVRNPFFAYTQSWDAQNYSFHYGSSRGTIAFNLHNGIFAGAIRDEQSSRVRRYPKHKAIELFNGASEAVQNLANNETLLYLLDEIDGITLPVATTAFWSEGSQIVLGDDMKNFLENGGVFISNILCSMKELNAYWKEEYALTEKEAELIDYLFRLKKDNHMELSKKDISVIDRKSNGYKDFVESLEEIGFVVKPI